MQEQLDEYKNKIDLMNLTTEEIRSYSIVRAKKRLEDMQEVKDNKRYNSEAARREFPQNKHQSTIAKLEELALDKKASRLYQI